MQFSDRHHAGQVLAEHLMHYAGRSDVVVLALPRGGVPVGFEIARELHTPLDVFLVRKLGVPGHEELAMGAIASGGVRVANEEVVQSLGISDRVLDEAARREGEELRRREQVYREGRPSAELDGRVCILVDDGLATGSTMRAAIKAVLQHNPRKLVVAVPVAAESTCEELRPEVDEVVCASTPSPFMAVGAWYEDFRPTKDEEVKSLLHEAAAEHHQQA